MKYISKTDVGKKYEHNEDYIVIPSKETNNSEFFVLCDGMGGRNAGEVASKLSANWLVKDFLNSEKPFFQKLRKNNYKKIISNLIEDINRKIFNLANKHEQYDGMGTTLVSALFKKDKLFIHSVGDSRCYRLRDNELEQLTEDQSEVWKLFEIGAISKDEIRSHPRRNIITMAIGTGNKVNINKYQYKTKKNDLYLLCSDGLTDMISEMDIKNIFTSNNNLEKISNQLIEAANVAGGKDNISVILILID
ncbi:MAG: Stp1/IreP family PP2C-type Ser/Thr phosphatase [Candidatus Cloacimonetes bacterium]|nr:Stp1/IreP family PP2C-type Ser/Thr phosphatase [Candidatus Cloacimonadota bacterium]MBT6994060.1 Stp1/IreP family PP2C-type Ser/Thr phosphatase [Candidatus Cloacimonadota bacterium]MBT7468907.1 Stp1/IreP family PP2C-type Ser/Thr phosphatase [Candidatus Cloacimonadota bacterium]